MKRQILILTLLLAFATAAFSQKNNPTILLKNSNDSLGYSLGLDLGESLKNAGFDKINLQAMLKGIQEQFDNKPGMDVNVARQYIQTEMQRMNETKSVAAKAEGIKFLEENKKKAGVVTTASGLQYKVITKGNGALPKSTDIVEVHYHGTLTNGTVFDSSIERGEKIEFPLDQVIAGWTEGLQLMPVGSKYIFYIPENLAYGAQDMGTIAPYSTLIFEVELFNAKPAQ